MSAVSSVMEETGLKRVLVTGAHGFTGQHVVPLLLAAGWDVWAIDRSPVRSGGVIAAGQCLQANLLDEAALQKAVHQINPQAVIHLAAIAYVGHGSADDFYNVNLLGTRHLLQALSTLDVRPQCVLLASSANIYGSRHEGALSESTVAIPANDYGVSKLAMEYMAQLWVPQLPIVIVRPFNYTGMGQSSQFLIPKIIDHALRKVDVIELGNLDVYRDFSDVRDVATAYVHLLNSAAQEKLCGRIFNVGSGRASSLREVLAKVELISGHTMEVKVNPAFVRANEVSTLRADTSALERVIGEWRSRELDETLRWMLRG